jgi:hypothetical protein
MTVEYILLFGMFAFILLGGFMGEKGPKNIFKNSAPRLGAHVEKQLNVGHQFTFQGNNWEVPPGPAPTGKP